jgi:acetyl esterase/lipase
MRLSLFQHLRPAFIGLFGLLLLNSSRGEETPAAPPTEIKEISYKSGDSLSDYERQRCHLDLYLPSQAKSFPTLVWFHGGGLTGGSKDGSSKLAESFAKAGLGVAAVNYRLSPKATYPAYIEDAAAAVTWVHWHIAEHGGDPAKVFVGGHSAGGYLTAILGMDPQYLSKAGVEIGNVAGFIPVSGQMMTHYTVREERGIGRYNITADEAAPIRYARAETQPFLVLYAEHDMETRAEENIFFVSVLRATGNKQITDLLVHDRTHGSIAGKMVESGDPAREAILAFTKAGTATGAP